MQDEDFVVCLYELVCMCVYCAAAYRTPFMCTLAPGVFYSMCICLAFGESFYGGHDARMATRTLPLGIDVFPLQALGLFRLCNVTPSFAMRSC